MVDIAGKSFLFTARAEYWRLLVGICRVLLTIIISGRVLSTRQISGFHFVFYKE